MSADWMDRGRCAEVDPELFFPEKGSAAPQAKRICAQCEVRAECLAYAVETGQQEGIWGGLNEKERREPRRLLRLAS